MKIRRSFVSNSSSSSFVCDVCGTAESGWDASVRDVGMYECYNGHIVCEEDLAESPEIETDDGGEYITEQSCPICSFLELCNRDVARYLEKQTKIPRDEIFQEVKKVNKRRKKLYDSEYVTSVCVRIGKDTTNLANELKDEFKEYKKFLEYIKK